MILVTVGNAFQPFNRLLSAADALAGKKAFGTEPVCMQTGHIKDFQAKHTQARAFWPLEEFERCMKDATLIITHGGCTVLEAIAQGKLPVVMPRARQHGEHVNDHQILFTQALAAQGRVIAAYEATDLPKAVAEALARGGRQSTPLPPSKIHAMIRESLDALARDHAA